jgi:hypothetical protein
VNTTDNDELLDLPVDATTTGYEAVREKMIDIQTPGFEVEFSLAEAERLGAFEEDALSEQDAIESNDYLAKTDGALMPFFITEEIEADLIKTGYVFDPPNHFNTTNIRELFGWKEGEPLDEAIARNEKYFS